MIRRISKFPRISNLIQYVALALSSATADRDNADGALDELERGDGFRIHLELPLLVAVHEADRPRGAGGHRLRRRGLRRGLGRIAGASREEPSHIVHRNS